MLLFQADGAKLLRLAEVLTLLLSAVLFDSRSFAAESPAADPLLQWMDQIAQQRAPMRCVPSEFESCYLVTHDVTLSF